MKFQPPFKYGVSPAAPGIHSDEPDAPYVNGNPATGAEGSIPPAEAFEHHQRELVHLITHSLQTPSHTDLEQVRKAIRWMIDHEVQLASVGGGIPIYQGQSDAFVHRIRSLIEGDNITITPVETAPGSGIFALRISAATGEGEGGESSPVTEWQNLPIFPEIDTPAKKLAITDNGNGTLTVNASQSIVWRGWNRVNTDNYSSGARTVSTAANKTYHLRLSRTDGFSLKDLANVGYNPTTLAEYDPAFDTTFDDMLVARITTNGSNVATVVPLANAHVMLGTLAGAPRSIVWPSGGETDHYYDFTLALARTPKMALFEINPPANAYDSDYSISPTYIRREAVRIYSWSWHHQASGGFLNMQSPGFSYQYRA